MTYHQLCKILKEHSHQEAKIVIDNHSHIVTIGLRKPITIDLISDIEYAKPVGIMIQFRTLNFFECRLRDWILIDK